MAIRQYKGSAKATLLVGPLSASATTIPTTGFTGWPDGSVGPFFAVINRQKPNEEKVLVTSVNGTDLIVSQRGADDTAAQAHSDSSIIEHVITATDAREANTHVNASDGHIGIGTLAARPSTNLVVGQAYYATDEEILYIYSSTNGWRASTAHPRILEDVDLSSTYKIKNMIDPTDAQDAVTKNWAETGMTSQLAQATTQATNAAASATAAATSETNAATSATNAATSATNAAASESSVATNAANAATSETNAAASAAAAATSATNAATSETNAGTSETNASTSATGAAASAVSAANSAAAAAAALDSFDDRYLGSKSSAPTVDNDGDPLVTGALFYLNTGTAEQIGMYVYDGSGWIKASAAATASITTYEYTATGSQTAFTGNDRNGVSLSFTGSLLQVFLNGVLLSPGNDYTTSTNTVTLASGATAGDEVLVVAFASFSVANTYTQAQADALFATQAELASAGFSPILLMGA